MTYISSFKGYTIEFDSRAEKDLKKLEKKDQIQIIKKLESLIEGKPNLDVKQLYFDNLTYRLRVGNYRVIFEVFKKEIKILVIAVRHRKEAYRS